MPGIIATLVDATRASTGLPPVFAPPVAKGVDFPGMVYPPVSPWGIPPDENADDYRALYQLQKDVYRCVWVISNAIASTDKRVMRDLPNGDTDDVTASKDFDLLRQPNIYMSEYDFWENTSGFLELAGECPWPLILEGNRVVGIVPLRPDKVHVIPSKTQMISHYEFGNGLDKFNIAKDEMIFLKYWNPNSDYRGLSPLRAATRGLELDLKAMKSNLSMLSKGVNPSGVLSIQDAEELDIETWDRFKAEFRREYAGEGKRGAMMLLRGNVEWKKMGLSNEEMQFLELLDMVGDSVGEVYGVPPALRMKFKEASKLANAKEQHKIFWDDTIRPKGAKIAGMLTRELLPRLTNIPNVRFEFDLSSVIALQPDLTELAEQYHQAIESGAASPDDYREHVLHLQRDGTPASQARYISNTLIPIETAGEKRQPELPKASGHLTVARPGLGRKIDQILGPFGLVSEDLSRESAGEVVARRWRESQVLKAEASLERIRRRVGDAFVVGVREIFRGIGLEVQANLRAGRAFWGTVHAKDSFDVTAVNFDVEEWERKLRAEGKVHLADAVASAGADLATAVGGEWDFNGSPGAVQWVNTRSAEYAHLAAGWTYEHVDALLRGAISDGLSIGETTTLLEGFFEKGAANHAEVVARTETIGAANRGRMESMLANEFEWHQWATMRDERVRPGHASADGEIVKVGMPFLTIGAGYAGDSAFPSDIMERCYTIPQKEGPK